MSFNPEQQEQQENTENKLITQEVLKNPPNPEQQEKAVDEATKTASVELVEQNDKDFKKMAEIPGLSNVLINMGVITGVKDARNVTPQQRLEGLEKVRNEKSIVEKANLAYQLAMLEAVSNSKKYDIDNSKSSILANPNASWQSRIESVVPKGQFKFTDQEKAEFSKNVQKMKDNRDAALADIQRDAKDKFKLLFPDPSKAPQIPQTTLLASGDTGQTDGINGQSNQGISFFNYNLEGNTPVDIMKNAYNNGRTIDFPATGNTLEMSVVSYGLNSTRPDMPLFMDVVAGKNILRLQTFKGKTEWSLVGSDAKPDSAGIIQVPGIKLDTKNGLISIDKSVANQAKMFIKGNGDEIQFQLASNGTISKEPPKDLKDYVAKAQKDIDTKANENSAGRYISVE